MLDGAVLVSGSILPTVFAMGLLDITTRLAQTASIDTDVCDEILCFTAAYRVSNNIVCDTFRSDDVDGLCHFNQFMAWEEGTGEVSARQVCPQTRRACDDKS